MKLHSAFHSARINQRWLDSGNFFFTRLSLFAYQFCCCFFAVISRHCCWGLLQCSSWNQFAMRSTWLQVAISRADGYSLHKYYPFMYRFSCAIRCNCFYVFYLSSCFIPYIISGIRRCSYVVSVISSHLLFNCDWSDLNSSMATYISIQDYIYLQHGFAWLIAAVINSFQAVSQI